MLLPLKRISLRALMRLRRALHLPGRWSRLALRLSGRGARLVLGLGRLLGVTEAGVRLRFAGNGRPGDPEHRHHRQAKARPHRLSSA